jgi:nitrite reductase/ring-hydroxylating ferredoxin subunit
MLKVLRWQQVGLPHEGQAACFSYVRGANQESGFVIRFKDQCYAYHNRCPHAGSPLDWVPGRFFNEDGSMLTCQTHGACFDPMNGNPLLGPATSGLEALPIRCQPDLLMVPAEVGG